MKTKLKPYCNLGWNQNKNNFIKAIAGHNEATCSMPKNKPLPQLLLHFYASHAIEEASSSKKSWHFIVKCRE